MLARHFLTGAGIGTMGMLMLHYHQAKCSYTVPGGEKSTKTSAIEAGTSLFQSFRPINAIHTHLCAFHFYSHDVKRQVPAHHFCSHLNEDVSQCVIYDSDRSDAKLIGIEYIVTEKVFRTFPEEEKKYWHSHNYEVKSGLLIAPGVPEMAETALMKELAPTYGKTIHTWQIDRDILPFGPPQLMMSFTQDGQVDESLVRERDQNMIFKTEELRRRRHDIPTPSIDPKVDQWYRSGTAIQFKPEDVTVYKFFKERR